ncbi:MAG: YqgE/AlgH family protein [Alphaproteobacteria bacterium]|nr:YqgE/AlgH family protein [Alphaproteobacteria bacterium]MBV9150684.1 YqgE/AlgH family protein [Alphaproteobacteria bacterium]
MKTLTVLILLAWAAVLPAAAEPQTEPVAGELLIASAAIQDPRFDHAVILLLRHDASGAFGVMINRPLGERPIAELLADATADKDKETKDNGVAGTVRLFLGGPVEPQYGFLIHGADYRRPETLILENGLAMTATKEALRDIGRHQGPAKYLFAAGYAGWDAGQLEGEIARRDWFTAPADPELVFDEARGAVWERALARRTREL